MTSAAESSPPEAVSNRLSCPQCGAENALPSGRRLIRCAFCDATLFVDRGGLFQHYLLPRLLDGERAAAALRRWMAGNETVKDLDRKAELAAPQPLSFPMWMFRIAGPGGEEVRVEPAAATPVPQLADLKVPAGQIEPYRAEEGSEAVAATVPLATARGWLGDKAGRISESALVQVPLWRCRYRYKGDEYNALVDGSTGAVLASVYPAKAESPFYITAALCLILFLGEGFLISNPLLKLAAYAVTGVPLALIAYFVTRKI